MKRLPGIIVAIFISATMAMGIKHFGIGFGNWDFIAKLKIDFFGGRKEYDTQLWYFLMFQMWHERWMEN